MANTTARSAAIQLVDDYIHMVPAPTSSAPYVTTTVPLELSQVPVGAVVHALHASAGKIGGTTANGALVIALRIVAGNDIFVLHVTTTTVDENVVSVPETGETGLIDTGVSYSIEARFAGTGTDVPDLRLLKVELDYAPPASGAGGVINITNNYAAGNLVDDGNGFLVADV